MYHHLIYQFQCVIGMFLSVCLSAGRVQAQEELLLELQKRLKEANGKVQATEEAKLALQRLVESTEVCLTNIRIPVKL